MAKLTDLLQEYLQAEINSCVAGHTQRIERLENRYQEQGSKLEDIFTKFELVSEKFDKIMLRFDDIETRLSNTAKRLGALEDRLMNVTTADLDKDALHEYLTEEFGEYLRTYAKKCGLEDLLEPSEVYDMVEDRVKDEIREGSAAFEGDEFEEAVKDVLRGI